MFCDFLKLFHIVCLSASPCEGVEPILFFNLTLKKLSSKATGELPKVTVGLLFWCGCEVRHQNLMCFLSA